MSIKVRTLGKVTNLGLFSMEVLLLKQYKLELLPATSLFFTCSPNEP